MVRYSRGKPPPWERWMASRHLLSVASIKARQQAAGLVLCYQSQGSLLSPSPPYSHHTPSSTAHGDVRSMPQPTQLPITNTEGVERREFTKGKNQLRQLAVTAETARYYRIFTVKNVSE